MKKEKIKQEIIEESKLLFKVTTKSEKEIIENYSWYSLKRAFSIESKPFKILAILFIITIPLYLITGGVYQVLEYLPTIIMVLVYIAILVVIFYFVFRYRIKKNTKKIDGNSKGTTTYFYEKGIVDKGEKIVLVNEYEDIKSIDRNKDDLYIYYKNNTATILKYETLTPKQKKIIDDIETKVFSNKPIKKPINKPETIVESKEKSRKTLLIIGLIAIYIVATLVGIVYLSDSEEETDGKNQYIVNKYIEELEDLKHADEDAYEKCKEILDQQEYYNDFHSSDYYLHGEEEYTLTIYANYVNEVTLHYGVSDILGHTNAEWGEWYLLNGDNYTNIDLYVYPKTEGYGIITITNDQDDRVLKIFVDNVDRDVVEFDKVFNHNIVVLNEEDNENNLINSKKVVINRIDDSHFLNEWRSIGGTYNTNNKWYAVEDIDNFNKYPSIVWILKEIDLENNIIIINELYFEDKPGELKYGDISKNKKEIKLIFDKDDQDFYEILNSDDELLATLATDNISGSLIVSGDSIEIYNKPNGDIVKTYGLENKTLFVNLIRAEKGETWYRIGKDMWVKAQPSIEYIDYKKFEVESNDSEDKKSL